MIAFDAATQRTYARIGKTEVWIWWYSPAQQFVVTTRIGGPGLDGKVTAKWFGREVGADAARQASVAMKADGVGGWCLLDGTTAPDCYKPNPDGTHASHPSSEYPNSVWIIHRAGDVEYRGRLDPDPEISFSYKFFDWTTKTYRSGTIGWAY